MPRGMPMWGRGPIVGGSGRWGRSGVAIYLTDHQGKEIWANEIPIPEMDALIKVLVVPGGDYFLTALTFEIQSGVEISMIFAPEKMSGDILWEHTP